jgi:hypothetical protein
MATEGSQGMSHQGTCHPGGWYSSGQHSWRERVTRNQARKNHTTSTPWCLSRASGEQALSGLTEEGDGEASP